METILLWWDSLEMMQQVLFCIAIPATLILLIQTILLIVGFGGASEGVNVSDTSGIDGFDADLSADTATFDADLLDADFDMSEVGDADASDGASPNEFSVMSMFSLQGIITFLCVFSWTGLVLLGQNVSPLLAMLVAFILGVLAMYGVAKLLQLSGKLAQNGTLNMKVLLGECGTVYIPIPERGQGQGKVTVQLAERFVECSAISEDGHWIASNTEVRITDIRDGNLLVVEPVK